MCSELFLMENKKETWLVYSGMVVLCHITKLKPALMAGNKSQFLILGLIVKIFILLVLYVQCFFFECSLVEIVLVLEEKGATSAWAEDG